jgi:hypothetical protein
MPVRILASKPRQGDMTEVTLYDAGLRLTATVADSMLASDLSGPFLQSIMDRERERIGRAKAVTMPGDAS